MSQSLAPFSCKEHLYNNGQDFLDIQYCLKVESCPYTQDGNKTKTRLNKKLAGINQNDRQEGGKSKERTPMI